MSRKYNRRFVFFEIPALYTENPIHTARRQLEFHIPANSLVVCREIKGRSHIRVILKKEDERCFPASSDSR